ncbi:hypothetical protein FB45DRAFT_1059482 [Roridomyces roridus]|uniref:Uncharacterized protein n=1 Tax=Roridomyces roridus TaxID=1738132 RepID=A0AAD7BRL6_9AGAR|nr:hypothetical protein FB45DRAFT_1059482 [Roridomyces roridus]
MSVPQELIDLIVDNLDADAPSLKSCSIAASTFLMPSQAHLFRKIEILPPPTRNTSDSNPCQRFHKILTSSPHLASLVQELRIVLVGSETSFEYDEDGEYLEERHPPWVMSGRTLALVLPLLKLKRISLVEDSPGDWNGGGDFSMKWSTLGRSLKSALTDVFSSPRLESALLRGIVVHSPKDLLSLFSDATALKSLSLSRVYFEQGWQAHQAWPEAQPWRPQLSSLLLSEIEGDMITRYFINPRIDLSQIISFTAASNISTTKDAVIAAVVSHNHVQDLGVYRAERLDIKPNLRSLRLFTTNMYTTMSDTFRSIPVDSQLESITFDGIMSLMFPSLDAMIASVIARLPSLRRVDIRVIPDERKNFSAWSTNLRDFLPSLETRGLLKITVFGDNNCFVDWE